MNHHHADPGQVLVNGIQTNGTLLNEDWCAFLAAEGFAVGLSLDGPQELHDRCRLGKDGKSTFQRTMHAYRLLRDHGVPTDILCVVNAYNGKRPEEVYRYFKQMEAPYVTFLPLVEERKGAGGASVP